MHIWSNYDVHFHQPDELFEQIYPLYQYNLHMANHNAARRPSAKIPQVMVLVAGEFPEFFSPKFLLCASMRANSRGCFQELQMPAAYFLQRQSTRIGNCHLTTFDGSGLNWPIAPLSVIWPVMPAYVWLLLVLSGYIQLTACSIWAVRSQQSALREAIKAQAPIEGTFEASSAQTWTLEEQKSIVQLAIESHNYRAFAFLVNTQFRKTTEQVLEQLLDFFVSSPTAGSFVLLIKPSRMSRRICTLLLTKSLEARNLFLAHHVVETGNVNWSSFTDNSTHLRSLLQLAGAGGDVPLLLVILKKVKAQWWMHDVPHFVGACTTGNLPMLSWIVAQARHSLNDVPARTIVFSIFSSIRHARMESLEFLFKKFIQFRTDWIVHFGLLIACAYEDVALVRHLLSQFSVTESNINAQNAMELAKQYQQGDVGQVILRMQSTTGTVPFLVHFAATVGNYAIVWLLVMATGLNQSMMTVFSLCYPYYQINHDFLSCIDIHQPRQIRHDFLNHQAITRAVMAGDQERLEALLDLGFVVPAHKCTRLLNHTIRSNRARILSLLLERMALERAGPLAKSTIQELVRRSKLHLLIVLEGSFPGTVERAVKVAASMQNTKLVASCLRTHPISKGALSHMLEESVNSNNVQQAKLLLAHGARPRAGCDLFSLAIWNQSLPMVGLLLADHPVRLTLNNYWESVRANDFKVFQLVYAETLKLRPFRYSRSLMLAAEFADLPIVQVVLQRPGIRRKYLRLAVESCAQKGRLAVLSLLLEQERVQGAVDWRRAITAAALGDSLECFALLLQCAEDPFKNGILMIQAIIRERNAEFFEQLVKHPKFPVALEGNSTMAAKIWKSVGAGGDLRKLKALGLPKERANLEAGLRGALGEFRPLMVYYISVLCTGSYSLLPVMVRTTFFIERLILAFEIFDPYLIADLTCVAKKQRRNARIVNEEVDKLFVWFRQNLITFILNPEVRASRVAWHKFRADAIIYARGEEYSLSS